MNGASSTSCMRVTIKASKTGPFRKGADLHIGLGSPPLCVVQAMMAYLFLWGNAPGSLLILQDGCPLSRVLLTDWLRQLFSAAGITGNFSSHSFRIGAATVVARNGVPDHLIQALRRWSSNANRLYLRKPAEALASLSQETDLTWWIICYVHSSRITFSALQACLCGIGRHLASHLSSAFRMQSGPINKVCLTPRLGSPLRFLPRLGLLGKFGGPLAPSRSRVPPLFKQQDMVNIR